MSPRAILVIALLTAGCAHYEIVGYRAGWKEQPAFDARDVTVIDYAFAVVAPDGSLVLDDPAKDGLALDRLVALKSSNPDLRVMLSVGGWTRSDRFSDMAADGAARSRFIASALALLERHKLDGIDIDWEYPTGIGVPCTADRTCQRPEDKRNFITLARELRRAFGERHLITIAAGADEKFLAEAGGNGKWLAELAPSLDWINLMTYDYHGSWERVANFNAPLDAVEASVARVLAIGIAPSKITLGMPFYGKGWTGCAPGPSGDGWGQPCTGLSKGSADETFDFAYLADRGYLSDPSFAHHRDRAARVPYLYNAATGEFITYDDERSIAEKAALVERMGLRGAMFWELDADRHGVLRGVVARSLAH